MKNTFARLFGALLGDPRLCAFEQRLFNSISLLNAVANLGGAFRFLVAGSHLFLLLLHLGSGGLFLLLYCWSRLRNSNRRFYWPFVIAMAAFLFVNVLGNAGSAGGAHYYLTPAVAIAVILSRSGRTTAIAITLFAMATTSLLVIEQHHPAWISSHETAEDRFWDVLTNLVFAQLFTGVLVMVLAANLHQERKKSERLLLNILPEPIAEELKRHDRVEPRQYDASVLFTDFVGFTKIAAGLTPQELVAELDGHFRQFDRIVKKHGLEKIKTIGDAFMAVGGLPKFNKTHAVDCVLAALEIQELMEEIANKHAIEGRPCWKTRIGVHSGPLIAGVIGQEKFAYDVWGETVNTASRMESSGVVGRVNISSETYERVKDSFECKHRGKVVAKNIGEIDMYLVVRSHHHGPESPCGGASPFT